MYISGIKMLFKPTPGQRLSADTISAIIEAINALNTTVINLASQLPEQAPRRGGGSEPKGNTSNPTVLGITQNTQDTDTWELDSATTPVTIKFMTEVYYDAATTHKIFCRYRTITIDTKGCVRSISAESDPVEITEAVACTAT
ncbi:MAG: hypothetical protein ABFD54_11470 [Armatimonadota bacterium]